MANADRTGKLFIRSAVVTAGTVATLFGAQNLAFLDENTFQTGTLSTTQTAQTVTIGDVTIEQSAPSVTILRHTGTIENHPRSESNPSGVSLITPPMPSQIIAGQTTIYQQPFPQVSQSSR